MAPDRRNQIALVALLVVLAGAAYRAWSAMSPEPASPAAEAADARGRPVRKAAAVESPDVHLTALEQDRPRPADVPRDLFRFKPKARPLAAAPQQIAKPPAASVPVGPPAPTPPPPIALKFIGVVERPEKSQRIAVLRDVAGHLLSGYEGAIIDGRFRILKIGVESIEMAYLDGRGRQTIRLSGG